MDDHYFSHLYEIASYLNKEFSLHAALCKSLEKTMEILHLETGWIWLTEPDHKSVYLAASHNLPPALSNHPERLSGWCYCIKQYLFNHLGFVVQNVEEIASNLLKYGYKRSYPKQVEQFRIRDYFMDADGNEYEFVQYLSEVVEERNSYEN